MLIGIDASRAFGNERTGTENYSYHIITQMLRLIEAKQHQFVLFVRPNTVIPSWSEVGGDDARDGKWPENVQIVVIPWRILWTQAGLSLATWRSYPYAQGQAKLDVLWIPAHTLPIGRDPKLKTVVTIHGLEYEWLPEYRNWLQKWYLPLSTKYAVFSANRLIAVSNFTQKQLVQRLNANTKHIKVIHEGVIAATTQGHQSRGMNVEREKFRTLNKWKLKEKQYILFVGTIQPRKNLGFLIDAYAQLPKSCRKQTKLVIAGGQGWMSEEVYLRPKELDLLSEVVFTGRVAQVELEALYRGALIYVQPSITEGFGLPVLEAMARGVPVIASDGGALPEVVGEAGIVLPVAAGGGSERSELLTRWASEMCRLIREPRLRERLVAAGLWRARKMSWETAAKETLNYLISI